MFYPWLRMNDRSVVIILDYVQMFIGDGAKLVRDAFLLAKEKSPCIIFIDEIDAIGTKRFDRCASLYASVCAYVSLCVYSFGFVNMICIEY